MILTNLNNFQFVNLTTGFLQNSKSFYEQVNSFATCLGSERPVSDAVLFSDLFIGKLDGIPFSHALYISNRLTNCA